MWQINQLVNLGARLAPNPGIKRVALHQEFLWISRWPCEQATLIHHPLSRGGEHRGGAPPSDRIGLDRLLL